MRVEVHYKDASRPLVYEDVANTYVKGPFYCVYLASGVVKKHPVANIWRVTEDY